MKQKLLTVIMDGVGERAETFGNAYALAHTPNLDELKSKGFFTTLFAHGTYVGLPSDADMGNSEVGHNTIGAGKAYEQGAKLIDDSIASKQIFGTDLWQHLMAQGKKNTLHFLGLLSDGNVHSHERHLYAMITRSATEGVKKIRIHTLFDGRDVPENSAEIYLKRLDEFLAPLIQQGIDIQVASGGGRMRMTMDRYGADWAMVERGFNTHVLGEAKGFKTPYEALTYSRENFQKSDQYIREFVITKNDKPIGIMEDGDALILFNFRGDRALEISKALESANFTGFERKKFPQILFAGMMEYDGDEKVPKNFLVSPPAIKNTLSEFLVDEKITQFACSETQKFGHMTYFWNGNKTGYLNKKYESYLEIPSDNIEFDQKPWMKAFEITEAVEKNLKDFDFLRINYPNGDMVGHTGNLEAAIVAMGIVDLMIGKLKKLCEQTNSILVVTADHGNCDEMFQSSPKELSHLLKLPLNSRPLPKTSHTLAKVPLIIYDPLNPKKISNPDAKDASLANLANTFLKLMNLKPQGHFESSLIN